MTELLLAIIAILIAATAYTIHRYRPHPPPPDTPPPSSALEAFLTEDLCDRTVRETGIDPATIDTRLPAFDWTRGAVMAGVILCISCGLLLTLSLSLLLEEERRHHNDVEEEE